MRSGVIGRTIDVDIERRQRVGDRVGDRGRRPDRSALAHSTKAAGDRGFAFDMDDVHIGDLGADGIT